MTATMQANGIDFSPTGQNISGFTVLIVDDSPLNLDVAFACLESKGYKVISAGNGIEALKIAEQVKPSLILLDIMMPEMDGFETCRRLKNLEGLKDIPVIFITAMTDIKSKREGFAAGAVDYVTKPFQPEELAARVQTHISLQLAYQHLKDSELRYRRLVETTPDAILVQNDRGIVYLNSSAMRLFGVDTPEELLGASLLEYAAKDDRELAEKQIALMCETEPGESSPLILHLLHADGSVVDVETSCSGITYQSIDSQMFVLRNVTERLRQEAVIEFQATHDPLTGLPNRSLYFGRVTQAIYHALRSGERLAVMFIDLDKFKLINDTLGHNAGDELLRVMANRLKGCTRDCDTLARIGGDEFVLLVDQAGSESALTLLAQRLIEAVSEPVSLLGHTHAITCSVGISNFPDDGEDVESLLKHADIAMYRAKEAGRNSFQFFTHKMQDRLNERLRLEMSLRQALEREEFVLHYQPQVDLSSGKVVGLEALIRWSSPELGMVPPDDFIPAAEENRLIIRIGEWVVRTVCRQLKTWQDQGVPLVPVAVNISASQFTEQKIVRLVKECLQCHGVEAKYLELELTETLSMSDPETSVTLMERLKGLGVSLSIDDFGTGYSNLSYLKRFPVHKLKIDRTFVSGLTNSPNDYSIVTAILNMARGLNIKTIAEGTETAGQVCLLAEHQCDMIQGYYFSRPVPVEDIEEMLRADTRMDLSMLGRQSAPGVLLVVDDEPNVLNSIKRSLVGEPYKVLTASSAAEAYEVLACSEVNVVMSDLQMPNESGVEFFAKIKKMYPETVRILLTGHGSSNSLEKAINHGEIYRYIAKPWENYHLKEVLSAAFLQYGASVGS